jgi:adenosylmethionine-8-amino-7-oxononanoate aminotransferase
MASTTFSSFLIENDRACIWHPFTQMQTARAPISITYAKGLYLYSENGKRYLDGISSWWCNLHGHSHPYIIEKIKEQAERLEHVIFADFTHAPAVYLALKLINLLPGHMSKVFYSDNGSTAVETAIKIAIQYWYNNNPITTKTKVICFKNSYHGDTFGAMSVSGKNSFNKPFWKQLFDVEMVEAPLPGKEELSFSQLKAALEKNESACFIFEPLVMGAGGMIMYPPEGLNELIRCCKQKGVLTIADEVMTGFGRTGSLFACEQLEEAPDMYCLSKGLTGGFLPLAATICTEEIFEAFLSQDHSRTFLHGHTYTANPLACNAALASLDLLLNDLCLKQREMIASCHRNFCSKWGSHQKLNRCESQGTILALEYKVNNPSYFQPLRDKLYRFFLGKGILLRPLGNVLYVLPPYCIEESELKVIYDEIILTLEGNI